MPNLCMYSMCVKGKKEKVEEFIKVIKAYYDYGTMEFGFSRHLFRVFEADCDEIEDLGNNVYQAIIGGNCAWSVSTCMFENGYYNNIKKRYPRRVQRNYFAA